MAKAFYRSAMVQLSIDTCNQLCAASLSEMTGDKFVLVGRESENIGRGHAELLALQVDRLLERSAQSPADLTRIAVTIGPGSFTGQRVGLALARSMAMALQIDLVGLNVLDALLYEARAASSCGDGLCCAILDAHRGGAYVKCIDEEANVLIDTSLLQVMELNEHLQKLGKPVTLIGTGARLVGDSDIYQHKLLDMELPDIESIAQLGHGATPTHAPVIPLYLRAPDAKPQSGKHLPLASQSQQNRAPVQETGEGRA